MRYFPGVIVYDVMSHRILVFYGSYRSDRMGIRLAQFVVEGLRSRGDNAELIDAKAVGLPMLDRMYREYPKGEAPPALEQLAGQIRDADGFVFITGEYNWGMQPGLKNLTDHFLEEWFWRPAAIASYSAGRFSGVRAALAWHGTLSEMGMVVISSSIAVGPIAQTLSEDGKPAGEGGKALSHAFPRFADDLVWWMEAARAQREKQKSEEHTSELQSRQYLVCRLLLEKKKKNQIKETNKVKQKKKKKK